MYIRNSCFIIILTLLFIYFLSNIRLLTFTLKRNSDIQNENAIISQNTNQNINKQRELQNQIEKLTQIINQKENVIMKLQEQNTKIMYDKNQKQTQNICKQRELQHQIEKLTQIITQKENAQTKLQEQNTKIMYDKDQKQTLLQDQIIKIIQNNNKLEEKLKCKNQRIDKIIKTICPGDDHNFIPCFAQIYKCQ